MEHHPLEEPGHIDRKLDPCILVIFGATGDLTARKLLPAIYNLKREGQLPAHFACVGFARREKSHETFRSETEKAISSFSRVKPIDKDLWSGFRKQFFYHQSAFDEDEGYRGLKTFLDKLDTELNIRGNRVFYLSTQPRYFPTIVSKLHEHQLLYDEKVNDRYSRVIIEKPFGHDYQSSQELQHNLLQHLREEQIYRIDHYLGKETVQNLLVFRFANAFFESLWNHRYIDHVQISAAESIGIGSRGKFYEEQGLLRDIMQNHMMQLLSLVAMEPPSNLTANSIRDEKVKVVESIRPFSAQELKTHCVRGQYGPGLIDGEKTLGYREEENVNPKSNTPTYAAVKLYIDNWRWEGVPFYLRGAKRLPKRCTEIAIVFKKAPGILFPKENKSNVLAIRIQPDEGISLKMNCKVPGPSSPIQPVKMDFKYGAFFGVTPPEAYERLICDCMYGDSTLFARQDEVLHAWKLFTPLLEYWDGHPPKDFPNYEAGSWGPKDADAMIEKEGRRWRLV